MRGRQQRSSLLWRLLPALFCSLPFLLTLLQGGVPLAIQLRRHSQLVHITGSTAITSSPRTHFQKPIQQPETWQQQRHQQQREEPEGRLSARQRPDSIPSRWLSLQLLGDTFVRGPGPTKSEGKCHVHQRSAAMATQVIRSMSSRSDVAAEVAAWQRYCASGRSSYALKSFGGETTLERDVSKAGADGFIAKPIDNLAAFQHAILSHLPANRQPPGPRILNDEIVRPDSVAYHDDLNHIAQVLNDPDDGNIEYVTQFLGGVARSAKDHDLDNAVRDLMTQRTNGANLKPGVAALAEMVQTRIAAAGPI